MISDRMKRFIEENALAVVASTDPQGLPHLATGRGLKVPAPNRIVFEAWFCRKTLANVAENPPVAVAVIDPASGNGYQLTGSVVRISDVAMLDGFVPGLEEPGMPQVQWRMEVSVEAIMEFSHGTHTDNPITTEA